MGWNVWDAMGISFIHFPALRAGLLTILLCCSQKRLGMAWCVHAPPTARSREARSSCESPYNLTLSRDEQWRFTFSLSPPNRRGRRGRRDINWETEIERTEQNRTQKSIVPKIAISTRRTLVFPPPQGGVAEISRGRGSDIWTCTSTTEWVSGWRGKRQYVKLFVSFRVTQSAIATGYN